MRVVVIASLICASLLAVAIAVLWMLLGTAGELRAPGAVDTFYRWRF